MVQSAIFYNSIAVSRHNLSHEVVDTMSVPGTNTHTHVLETPASFRTPLLEAVLGHLGRLSRLELATEPSPPHSAGESSAAALQPGGFSAAGLKKAPLDGPLTRVRRVQ